MTDNLSVSDRLTKRLIALWDDREFVVGILSIALTEKERSVLLNFMERGENVTVETVSVLAIRLKQQREKKG